MTTNNLHKGFNIQLQILQDLVFVNRHQHLSTLTYGFVGDWMDIKHGGFYVDIAMACDTTFTF